MEAKGLSIDNLVYKFKDDKRVVCKITGYDLYTWQLNGKQWTKIEPIELTNKWLIKSGLKKGIGIHNDRFSGIIKVVKASYMQSFELYIGNIHIKNVDYIHDVQNLFRELTDIELEIK